MRLLKLLRKKPFCNDFHFILISILLFLLSLKYWPFFIVLGLYFIYLFKKTKLILPSLILIVIFTLEILSINLINNIRIENEINAYIYDILDEDNYIILYKGSKIKISEYNHENMPGDYISLSIELRDIEDKSYDTDFDYKEYLLSKGISKIAKGKTKNKLKSYFSIFQIKYSYLNYLKNHLSYDSYSYISAVVFGNNNLEDNIKDSYSILGISHILAISGLHIIFLFKVLSFLLLKIFKYYKKAIPITLLIIYVIAIGFPISALRALLFIVIGTLNKKGDVSYTRLDILSISGIFTLLLNPYQFYQTSFLLSYLVSFILIFTKKDNMKIRGMYKTYYLIYFSTFPIVINITNKISFLSFILSPLISLALSFIIIPISYILAIFPVLDYGLKYIYIFINNYLEGITSYNLIIHVPSFNILSIVFYYIFFILLIIFIAKGKKIYYPFLILSIYIISFINLRYLNPFYNITYLNVGQGDSSIIELPYSKGIIVIDAYNSYDYIKDLGFDSIDSLILTHSDSDHIGDYEKIIQNLNVKKIYVPSYDLKFDEIMANYNLIKIKSDDVIRINDFKMEVLGPINSYSDPNSNSIVLKFEIDNIKYLFTGDATEKEENDLIEKYGSYLDIDILKVAHHGSITSSSIHFLEYATPKISIISVAKKNNYGLPDPIILNRLSNYSKIYQTYISGNIKISIGFGKVHISTYR